MQSVRNPHQYLYSKYVMRRSVNLLQLDKMTRDFYKHKFFNFLDNTCKVTGHIAVSSQMLKRRQREKYKDSRLYAGRNVFYLFPCNEIPFDVYHLVQPIDGKFIYTPSDA